MSLFSEQERENLAKAAPLAARMRPRTLNEFFGQKSITGDNAFLRKLINSDNVPSLLFFGPPGCGKTTLAHIIANGTKSHFEKLNAVAAGTADVKRLAEEAYRRLRDQNIKTIVFIDEIHRFNKLQQDSLLPHVESGAITLIGATTENPYTEVNPPLLSRMRAIRLNALGEADLISLMRDAIVDNERGMGVWAVSIAGEAETLIAMLAAGDARVALNVLEQAVFMAALQEEKQISAEIVRELTGEIRRGYDPDNNNRSDIVSAFIKSMRGSDPQAVSHYMARLLSAGEDPEFIARRIVVAASEDVGNADPMALVVATNALLAIKNIGMPEARIILSQAAIYIACAPKSNAAYCAVDDAIKDVEGMPVYLVPVYLRNHYDPQLTAGKRKYLYPHAFPGNWVEQQYLPDEMVGKKYYVPTDNGYEQNLSLRLNKSKIKE
ncbi:MAG: replication-associated recombination protein A [Negativicutes bacterium]|jgi:putative ATPase